jgi:hypothetical protein
MQSGIRIIELCQGIPLILKSDKGQRNGVGKSS